MKTAFLCFVFFILVACTLLQELGYIGPRRVVLLQELGFSRPSVAASTGRQADALRETVDAAIHDSSSLALGLSGLIQERRKDFNTIVFDPIVMAQTNEVAQAEEEAQTNEVAHANEVVATGSVSSNKLHALHFRNHSHVEAEGKVVLLISPETAAEVSQKFMVRLASGKMVLVNYDIAVAPPVENLKLGDVVTFSGEYSVGQNGDEINLTYEDPAGVRKSGWIRHNGRTYQ